MALVPASTAKSYKSSVDKRWRAWIPVLLEIQVSLVSKKVAKSSLVTVRDGNALPVPIIFICVSIKIKIRFRFLLKRCKSTATYDAAGKMCRIRAECGENRLFVAKNWHFCGENAQIKQKETRVFRVSVVNYGLIFTSHPCLEERLGRLRRLDGPSVPVPSYRNGRSRRLQRYGCCICRRSLTAHTGCCSNAQSGCC